jgi:hypothetical protein
MMETVWDTLMLNRHVDADTQRAADKLKAYLEEMAQTWPDGDADIVQRKASFFVAAIPPDCTNPHLVSALKNAKRARKFGLTLKGEMYIRDAFDALDAYERECIDRVVLPLARIGKKSLDGSKRGHEETHGTPEEKKARHEKYKAEFDRLREKNPSLSDHAIDVRVAEKFEVNSKTIQRARKKKNPA